MERAHNAATVPTVSADRAAVRAHITAALRDGFSKQLDVEDLDMAIGAPLLFCVTR